MMLKPDIKQTVVSGHTFSIDPKYDLTNSRILGRGSYGVVTTAIDTETNQKMAIKRIRPYANDEWDARHTLREIRLLKLLGPHPNVITLYNLSLFEDKTELYMMMELMDCDLHHIIQSKQALTEMHHKCFAKQLLEGIKAMHSVGVFHRDLKPGNLLVSKDCKLRITDFGLARYMDESTLSGNNSQNPMTEYVVTRWYRSPELLLAPNKPYSEAIDLWSIGCIMAELMRRKPLFAGKSHANQVQLIFEVVGYNTPADLGFQVSMEAMTFLNRRCKFPRQNFNDVLPGASPEAVEFISALLCVDPKKRPTAFEALNFKYIMDAETLCDYDEIVLRPPPPSYFEFETAEYSLEQLRDLIHEEVEFGGQIGHYTEEPSPRYNREESPRSPNMNILSSKVRTFSVRDNVRDSDSVASVSSQQATQRARVAKYVRESSCESENIDDNRSVASNSSYTRVSRRNNTSENDDGNQRLSNKMDYPTERRKSVAAMEHISKTENFEGYAKGHSSSPQKRAHNKSPTKEKIATPTNGGRLQSLRNTSSDKLEELSKKDIENYPAMKNVESNQPLLKPIDRGGAARIDMAYEATDVNSYNFNVRINDQKQSSSKQSKKKNNYALPLAFGFNSGGTNSGSGNVGGGSMSQSNKTGGGFPNISRFMGAGSALMGFGGRNNPTEAQRRASFSAVESAALNRSRQQALQMMNNDEDMRKGAFQQPFATREMLSSSKSDMGGNSMLDEDGIIRNRRYISGESKLSGTSSTMFPQVKK